MKSLRGQLLIASPTLLDPNFTQSVVLMVQHDEKGALGLVLNRPVGTTIRKAWEQISDKPCARQDTLYLGGPCQGLLMAIHGSEPLSQMEILPGVYFSTEADAISRLVEDTDVAARFFVGYAGWSAGQLEDELASGSWLTMQATYEQVFQSSDRLQWKKITEQIAWAIASASLNPKVIPEDPSTN